MQMSKLIWIVGFVLAGPLFLTAQISGKVTDVYDGDSFTLLAPGNVEMKIRLHGVYCPELKQDYGQRAKQFTSSQIFGKTVTVKSSKKDRYGRTIGTVYLANGQILNELLLQNGLAWHSKKYDSNTYWAQLETNARNAKRGLWAISNPIPPWTYRSSK
jgi:endonuclease YncB( thermonuclease family)